MGVFQKRNAERERPRTEEPVFIQSPSIHKFIYAKFKKGRVAQGFWARTALERRKTDRQAASVPKPARCFLAAGGAGGPGPSRGDRRSLSPPGSWPRGRSRSSNSLSSTFAVFALFNTRARFDSKSILRKWGLLEKNKFVLTRAIPSSRPPTREGTRSPAVLSRVPRETVRGRSVSPSAAPEMLGHSRRGEGASSDPRGTDRRPAHWRKRQAQLPPRRRAPS